MQGRIGERRWFYWSWTCKIDRVIDRNCEARYQFCLWVSYSTHQCLNFVGAQRSLLLCFWWIFKYWQEFTEAHKYCTPKPCTLLQNQSLSYLSLSQLFPVICVLSYHSAYMWDVACRTCRNILKANARKCRISIFPPIVSEWQRRIPELN